MTDDNSNNSIFVNSRSRNSAGDREPDMTPMVDVTFLLLIFFVVTASFTLQRSLEQPPTKSDQPSDRVDLQENEDQYVEVIVDQNNSFFVTSRDIEMVEAPTDRELRSQLNDMKQSTRARRLIIRAHEESTHNKVVTAWNTGIAAGMTKIEIQTTAQDF